MSADADLLAALGALADEWTQATCQTDGAPCSWHRVAAECAAELRRTIAAHQPAEPDDIAAMIERSSFGTPEAQALRATVSDEHAARIVARARELEANQSERTDTAEALSLRQIARERGITPVGTDIDAEYPAQPSEPERGKASVERVDRYTIAVNDVSIRATEEQERRIRQMTPEQIANFLRVMGADR